ncbi:competence protein ComK [Rossellomorea aquimaris]|uniref:competence protein ComK n=1 Tax=Rossellomorea aquimaris TaxID=189382 RepID=UPI0007D05981|nr:competence protein ComK [Rossellomorea aquimaris]
MRGKSRIIEEYEVNPHTMMLKPIEYGSRTFTEILEVDDVLVSPFKPFEILRKSCEFFGSSYEGRKEGTKKLTGIVYKAPIIVNPQMSIFLFPTVSPTKQECAWVSHSHVRRYDRSNAGFTKVFFQNRQSCDIPISYSSFENQMLRTSDLRIAYSQRISEMESKYTMVNTEVKKVKTFYLNRNSKTSDA